MHGDPTQLAQLPVAKEQRQKSEQKLWKSPVKERVLEKIRRQFHAIRMNALLQVLQYYLFVSKVGFIYNYVINKQTLRLMISYFSPSS